MRITALAALALILVPFAPTALAQDCVSASTASACVSETTWGFGSCDSFGARSGETRVIVNTAAATATAVGQSACITMFGSKFEASRVAVGAAAAGAVAWVDWAGYASNSGSGCSTIVYTSATGGTDVGCPAGRPPGWPLVPWGSLLP